MPMSSTSRRVTPASQLPGGSPKLVLSSARLFSDLRRVAPSSTLSPLPRSSTSSRSPRMSRQGTAERCTQHSLSVVRWGRSRLAVRASPVAEDTLNPLSVLQPSRLIVQVCI